MSLNRWNKHSLLSFVDSHIINYPTPINLNYVSNWSENASSISAQLEMSTIRNEFN